MPFIITIDGPAGSGKSTAARKLAERLKIAHLDTGAMYRAVTSAIQEAHVNPEDAKALAGLLEKIVLKMVCLPPPSRIWLNGREVTDDIRQADVTAQASAMAQFPLVRARLIALQRQIAEELGQLVSEGRDQGLTVFPHAACKFVLQASLEKRAERRFNEMAAQGIHKPMEWVLENLRSRDANDSPRWLALLNDPAAQVLDTTDLTIPQMVERMEEIVRPRLR